MDPATLAASVTALLVPYLAKAGASLADEALKHLPEAVGGLWQAVAQRFKGKPAAEGAANDLAAEADDTDNQEAFSVQLKKMLKDDPTFAEEINGLLEKAQASVSVTQQGSGAAAANGGVAAGAGGSAAAGAGGLAISGTVSGNVSFGSNQTSIDTNYGPIESNKDPK